MTDRPPRPHALVVRLDSLGDMIVCGPAIRAIAAGARRVSVLAGPRGAAAARLLPGVDAVFEWPCPWIARPAPAVSGEDVDALLARVRDSDVDEAIVLTSFHQNALPTALLLRLAGVGRITAVSDDYPGSLLDVRVGPPADAPEPVRMLHIARAAGYTLPDSDDGRLRVCLEPGSRCGAGGYLVLHPGVDAPARAYPIRRWGELVAALTQAGRTVVLTGTADESDLCASIASQRRPPGTVHDRSGRTSLPELAALVADADAMVVGNTGPAHLAAATDTPVVSLFAPVVSATRWAPYSPDVVVLGDQQAACRDSRAQLCPVDGHPCLSTVTADNVTRALNAVTAAAARRRAFAGVHV